MLLGEKEVAQLLGMSESYLRQYRTQRANKGHVPNHVVVGKRIRYEKTELEAWIRSQQNPTLMG